MTAPQINGITGKIVTVLSVLALLTVLLGLLTGYKQPAPTDEGALAHIFQLTILALVPMILLFLGTVDWKRPWPGTRPLALPATALMAAFAALYYLEHYGYK
jgi:hypothetical protein